MAEAPDNVFAANPELEERRSRDLRLIESMQQHVAELEADLEEYAAFWIPAHLLGLMRHSIDNTKQLIRQLRGEASKDAA